jgi:hypothetical protein
VSDKPGYRFSLILSEKSAFLGLCFHSPTTPNWNHLRSESFGVSDIRSHATDCTGCVFAISAVLKTVLSGHLALPDKQLNRLRRSNEPGHVNELLAIWSHYRQTDGEIYATDLIKNYSEVCRQQRK